MNKKLVLVAALVFGVAGLMMANTVKAQDATMNSTDNSTTTTDNGTTTTDNSTMNSDAGAAPAAQ